MGAWHSCLPPCFTSLYACWTPAPCSPNSRRTIHFQVFLQLLLMPRMSPHHLCMSNPPSPPRHCSAQATSFIFQMSPDPLPPLNSPDHSLARILRTWGLVLQPHWLDQGPTPELLCLLASNTERRVQGLAQNQGSMNGYSINKSNVPLPAPTPERPSHINTEIQVHLESSQLSQL